MNIDPKRVWFASDLIPGEEGLTENQLVYFLKTWDKVVRDDDYICILGNLPLLAKEIVLPDGNKNLVKYTSPYWMGRIQKELPGNKILLLGAHDKNGLRWYYKYGFKLVVPFGDTLKIRHDYGNILLSSIPCFESVLASFNNERFLGVSRRLHKQFDAGSCILNIHGYTRGNSVPNGKTFDVSLPAINYAPILLEQVIDFVFKGTELPEPVTIGC